MIREVGCPVEVEGAQKGGRIEGEAEQMVDLDNCTCPPKAEEEE